MIALSESTASSHLQLLRAQWETLSEMVQDYDPTVVVVVARKPARLLEAVGLQLAPGALILSDLAMPFATDQLLGARVAVVDDVVNVGSTILRASRRALEAGAVAAQAFAISSLDRETPLDGLEVQYAMEHSLDGTEMGEFARRIPEALQSLPKPYDLDFPVLRCTPRAPIRSFRDLLGGLRSRHGEERVYDLSTAAGASHQIRRCAVDLNDPGPVHRKVRVYFDEDTLRCNIVPISVAPALDGAEVAASGSARRIWSQLAPLVEQDIDARCRLRLFIDSLMLGERFVAEHSELLHADPDKLLDLDDAQLVLGPRVRLAAQSSEASDAALPPAPAETDEPSRSTSPFLEAATREGLMAAIVGAARGPDPISAFIACFDTLAKWVGAYDPAEYRLNWPYTAVEIDADPYRRLRIGPTIPDLVEIVGVVTKRDDVELTRREVTRLLDRFIDAGGVVPTTAQYGERIYRIYRKGEAKLREEVSDRAKYAWSIYNKPLSLTRATKLLAILELDRADGGSETQVSAAPRGNTLTFQPSLLDAETEVTQYLRNTNQLYQAQTSDE